MNIGEIEQLVHERLEEFYRRRLQKLTELKLKETLQKKNPYLFRAIGVQNAAEIVQRILQAFMSSSEETIFGDAFFEPFAKAICGGVAAGGSGVDVVIEKDVSYTVLSIKSGPNWGNSSQMAKLEQDFRTARRVFDNKKLRKQFRALLGHCYGRKRGEPKHSRSYAVRSGQAFWQELTGDPGFYLKLIHMMGGHPSVHRENYEKEWDKAFNRFLREFVNDFCKTDGEIDWERLVCFNSGAPAGRLGS